jgi:hypothetical protein
MKLLKEVITYRVRWMPLIVEWNASTNMFYLLKDLLFLMLVIFKLKCYNIIFNEIMVLNASYVCLHAFSLRRESPDLDPRRRTPHFWASSVTAGIRVRSGLNTHSKHLKISTTFMVRTLSPYKDNSSLLRWQANCVYILQLWNCVNEGMLWFLRVFDLFYCWWHYFVVCAFCRTIRTCVCLLFCLWDYLVVCA